PGLCEAGAIDEDRERRRWRWRWRNVRGDVGTFERSDGEVKHILIVLLHHVRNVSVDRARKRNQLRPSVGGPVPRNHSVRLLDYVTSALARNCGTDKNLPR